MIIPRPLALTSIKEALGRSPVVVLTGPRQCGKTTLAREFLPHDSPSYFDLEDPVSLMRLQEPMTALEPLKGLVVIDEIQRRPELFPVLRVLVDRPDNPLRFLILGSASGDLLRQSSESLAGRTERINLGGFTLDEVGPEAADLLWLRGGFPRAFLAGSHQDASRWKKDFIQTLLERDFPQWGVRTPASALRRFWAMLAHYHGQTWNASEPARSLGVSPVTTRGYLDLLTDALMIRQLSPWHANLAKRQVKSPKLYFRDTGLLHQLMGITSEGSLYRHPKMGASWEGFALEQALRRIPHDEAYFWATHQGAEIDLLLVRNDDLLGVEFKRADAPKVTRSIRIAMEDLGLAQVLVLYPGSRSYRIEDGVDVIPLSELAKPEPNFPFETG